MLPPRPVIVAFALRFLLILGVYLLPWAPIGKAYSTVAIGVANLAFGDVPIGSPPARLHFEKPSQVAAGASAPFAAELRAVEVASGAEVRLALDLRSLAYVPSAVFVALAIAAPIWERRRGAKVLLFGLGGLHLFLLASLATPLVLFFANPAPMKLVELGHFSFWVLSLFHRTFVVPPAMTFAVPTLVWLCMLWLVPSDAAPTPLPSTARTARTAPEI